jgi:hypothetical protein
MSEQSFSELSPAELTNILYSLLQSHFRLSQPGGPDPRIYIPQEYGGPVINNIISSSL